jgi:hypothetical protein
MILGACEQNVLSVSAGQPRLIKHPDESDAPTVFDSIINYRLCKFLEMRKLDHPINPHRFGRAANAL